MYLSEATSNVLKFIYAILVSNNDEKGMTYKKYNLHKSAANIISELNSFLSIILATPTSKADYYLLTLLVQAWYCINTYYKRPCMCGNPCSDAPTAN